MSDDNTSFLRCPKCGEHLVRDQAGDILSCPAHGAAGKFHELAKAEVEDILREVREALDKAFNEADD